MKNVLRREVEYFFAAIRFFTRIPVPDWVGHSAEQLNHAARYFPLAGIVVGTIGAAATFFFTLVLPLPIAILLGMVATLLTTGAFHEDGFADAVDGFGGGWEKTRILEIMKDSRVGSYGAIAIGMILLLKFVALHELALRYDVLTLATILIVTHALSRFASTTLLCVLDYVREDELSKSKPLAKHLSSGELMCAACFGILPTLAMPWLNLSLRSLMTGMALVAITTWTAARYFKKHIGGYTGDCLGATQQVTEVIFYLGLLCAFS